MRKIDMWVAPFKGTYLMFCLLLIDSAHSKNKELIISLHMPVHMYRPFLKACTCSCTPLYIDCTGMSVPQGPDSCSTPDDNTHKTTHNSAGQGDNNAPPIRRKRIKLISLAGMTRWYNTVSNISLEIYTILYNSVAIYFTYFLAIKGRYY